MTWGLPPLTQFLTPLLQWATAGVAVIASIILIWSIYDTWTQNPERFSWWGAIFKALGVGLIALVAANAQRIIQAFVGGAGGGGG